MKTEEPRYEAPKHEDQQCEEDKDEASKHEFQKHEEQKKQDSEEIVNLYEPNKDKNVAEHRSFSPIFRSTKH